MNSARSTVPGRTYVHIAPVGSTAPTDATSALAAAWVNVGHTTPDSLSFSTEPEFEEMPSAQADFPIRRFQTSDAGSVEVDLIEWSGANFKSAFGGGTITSPSVGVYKFVPPKLGARSEVAVIIEVIDGSKNYRYIFPRMMQVEGVEFQLQKGAGATLPLRLAVLGSDGGDAWYLLTNDAAFTP